MTHDSDVQLEIVTLVPSCVSSTKQNLKIGREGPGVSSTFEHFPFKNTRSRGACQALFRTEPFCTLCISHNKRRFPRNGASQSEKSGTDANRYQQLSN